MIVRHISQFGNAIFCIFGNNFFFYEFDEFEGYFLLLSRKEDVIMLLGKYHLFERFLNL